MKLAKKEEILECHSKAMDLTAQIQAKQEELAKCEEAHSAKLEEKRVISNRCKKSIDSKKQELNICKAKYEQELAEHMRQETLACVTTEDELSSTLRILDDMHKADEQYAKMKEYAMTQQFME